MQWQFKKHPNPNWQCNFLATLHYSLCDFEDVLLAILRRIDPPQLLPSAILTIAWFVQLIAIC